MSGRIVMGYWDCHYCGTKGIDGTSRDCPHCGHPRSENTRFYMNKDNVRYLGEEQAKTKGKGPDWLCEYCGSLNSALEYNCTSCGASKGTSKKDYFDIHEEENEQSSVEKEGAFQEEFENLMKEAEALNQNLAEVQKIRKELESNFTPVDPPEKLSLVDKVLNFIFSEEFLSGLKVFGLFALVVASVFLLIQAVTPKPETITVNGFGWETSVEVESYETVTENDWVVPSGGRLLYAQEEIHHYDEVFSHYEQETRTYTEQVLSGYETYYTYSNNGDGTFTEHAHSNPVYTTEIRTETVDVPVYDDVPVYETMYYYEIEKWVYNRTETAAGTDKFPYYANVQFASNERERSRNIRYTVYCTIDGEEKEYSCSQELWEMFEAGETYDVMVSGGIIECLAEDASFSLVE